MSLNLKNFEQLDKSGCAWGHEESLRASQRVTDKLEQEIKESVKEVEDRVNQRYDSKFESCESVSNTCLALAQENKEELGKVKSVAIDAVSCTHDVREALKQVKKKWVDYAWDLVPVGLMLTFLAIFAGSINERIQSVENLILTHIRGELPKQLQTK